MPGKKIISATMLLTITAAFIGERRAGRTLPRPKALAAIFAMYGLLGVAAEMGGEAERVAGAVAVVLLVATVFVGAAGKTLVDFLNTLSGWVTPGGKADKTAAPAPVPARAPERQRPLSLRPARP